MQFKSIIDLEIVAFKLMVSFSGPTSLSLLNVNQLVISMPDLSYEHRIWSGEDFMNRLKKDIIKVIVQHTGKILGNKFKPNKKIKVDKPLKQISDYRRFMTLEDLQRDGRERDSSSVDHKLNLGQSKSRLSHQSQSLDHLHPPSHTHHNGKHMRPITRREDAGDGTFEAYLDPADDKVEIDIDSA